MTQEVAMQTELIHPDAYPEYLRALAKQQERALERRRAARSRRTAWARGVLARLVRELGQVETTAQEDAR
jgi:hypothetical protein